MRASVESVLSWFRRCERRIAPGLALNSPLLDAEEIGELALRVHHANQPFIPGPQVAHRRLGDNRSVFRGTGMDYDESRPYQPGDDSRAMDWRLTARTGEPYVRLFREERRPATFILVDRRAAMRFGTRVRLKVTQAARAAAIAAFDAQRRQSAVAGLLLESHPQWIAESIGTDAAFRFASMAAQPAPPQHESLSEPSLDEVLSQLAQLLLRGSSIWLISDFHDLATSSNALLLKLASEHRVRAVHVVDQAELTLPAAGLLRLYPAGEGRAVEIDSADAALRERFSQATSRRQLQLQEQFAALNIPYVRLLGETDALEQELPL